MFVVAFRELGRAPALADAASGAMLFLTATVILHALWTFAMCTVFFAVRTDNLTDVFSAVFDAARWPSSVFRGAVRLVLTFVVPLGLMTTVPARALLGSLDLENGAIALAEAVALALVARVAWVRSLAHYTSASS